MPETPGQIYIQTNVQPPEPYSINWKAAPRPFKLYHNSEHIPCAYQTTEQPGEIAEDGLSWAQLGQMLADIYGLTRLCQTIIETKLTSLTALLEPSESRDLMFNTSLQRPVPAGGALFPCELYLLVGPGKSVPAGIYHYDAAHHTLDILRQGDFSHQLSTSLAHPGDNPPAYTLLLSCCFWKNGFKYGAFSYRLQGLDSGAVIAQTEIIGSHYNLAATIHYQFLDLAVDELLGLDPFQESVYAIMTLAPAQPVEPNATQTRWGEEQAEPVLSQPLPTAEPLESIARWPMVEAVHRAALIETCEAFCELHSLPPIARSECSAQQKLCASDTPLNLWRARHQRRSAIGPFTPEPLTEQQLAQLLLASTRDSANDLDGRSASPLHTLLYCVVQHVQNVPAGIYVYHPQRHALEIIRTEGTQGGLQSLLRWPGLDLSHASVCLLPVAHYTSGFQVYGDRWYRIQNMEAGIIVQRLYLAAAALKLGCRAGLGYPIHEMDTFLGLPDAYTSLIQVVVAPERQAYRYYRQSLLMEQNAIDESAVRSTQ